MTLHALCSCLPAHLLDLIQNLRAFAGSSLFHPLFGKVGMSLNVTTAGAQIKKPIFRTIVMAQRLSNSPNLVISFLFFKKPRELLSRRKEKRTSKERGQRHTHENPGRHRGDIRSIKMTS